MNRGDVKLIIDRCVAHDVPDAADLIERQAAQINHLQMALADTEALESETSARCLKQAAQIKMMRDALSKIEYLESANGCIMSAGDCSSVATEALSTTSDQALEQFAAKVREQCAIKIDMLKTLYLTQDRPVQETALLVAACGDSLNAIRAYREAST